MTPEHMKFGSQPQGDNIGKGNGSEPGASSRRQPEPSQGNGSPPNQAEPGAANSDLTTAPIVFYFNGQELRAFLRGGEPWFVAADVCAVLEHTDPSKAVSRLDDDERGANIVRTLGGDQRVNVISESGLYSLTFTSRKPEAKNFRRWITHEVIPSIRRTGRYEHPAWAHTGRHGLTNGPPAARKRMRSACGCTNPAGMWS